MKYSILAIILLSNISFCMGQQVDYYPEQKENVSDDNCKMAYRILEETYTQIKKNNGTYNYVNYWNLAVAYNMLKQENTKVKQFLELSKKYDPFKFSLLFTNNKNKKSNWARCFTDEEYNSLLKISSTIVEKAKASDHKNFDEAINEMYDQELVHLIRKIDINDQKYRSGDNIDLKKQKIYDDQNQQLIDSLYSHHGQYIGKTLVGDHNSYVMWSVIQHSNVENMEKYLPIIYQASKEKELDDNMLKMLLDRIYTERKNYQIFGSQMGVTIAPDTVVNAVKMKYEMLPHAKKEKVNSTNSKDRMNTFLSRSKT